MTQSQDWRICFESNGLVRRPRVVDIRGKAVSLELKSEDGEFKKIG